MFESRVRPDRISSPITSMAAVGLGMGCSLSGPRTGYRPGAMRFPTPLVPARLIRRYKRFLADMVLEATARSPRIAPTPAPCWAWPSRACCWLEPNDDPRRKLRFAWRLVELPGGHWAGIDTALPNRVVGEALARGRHRPGLPGYDRVRPEVRYGDAQPHRFPAEGAGPAVAYVEVKNVHLRRISDWAEFPDCVTARGARHLDELSAMVAPGTARSMLYLVQRTDCARFAAGLRPRPGLCPRLRGGDDGRGGSHRLRHRHLARGRHAPRPVTAALWRSAARWPI
jgi:sugar fermentation stimulation protein A